MKKYIALFLTLALILTLAACGEGTAQNTAPGTETGSSEQLNSGQTGEERPADGETRPEETQDVPFGDYHSEEELLAILESGDFSEYLAVDPEGPTEPVDSGGDESYTGFSNAITFTDGGDGEGVEFTDFMENLSPEQRAEWEEAEKAMTDPEMMESFGDTFVGEDAGTEEAETEIPDLGEIDWSEYGLEDFNPEDYFASFPADTAE